MGNKKDKLLWSGCTIAVFLLLAGVFFGSRTGEGEEAVAPSSINLLAEPFLGESTPAPVPSPIVFDEIVAAADLYDSRIQTEGGAKLLGVTADGSVVDMLVSAAGALEITAHGATPAKTVKTEEAVFVKQTDTERDLWKKYATAPDSISGRLKLTEPSTILRGMAEIGDEIIAESTAGGDKIITMRLIDEEAEKLLLGTTLKEMATEVSPQQEVTSPTSSPAPSSSPASETIPEKIDMGPGTWGQIVLNSAGEFVRFFVTFSDGTSILVSLSEYQKVSVSTPAVPLATPSPSSSSSATPRPQD